MFLMKSSYDVPPNPQLQFQLQCIESEKKEAIDNQECIGSLWNSEFNYSIWDC
jgi:hypothetical protein